MTVDLRLWLVCNSSEKSPWKTYIHWARQKMSCILWSTNFHYLIQNSLQLNPNLSHESPGNTRTTVISRGNFSIIFACTLIAVTWTVYVTCLVSNCMCYIFLVCPLHLRLHIKSSSCCCIFCFACYLSSVSETKYRPCFVKRAQFNISVLQ